MDKQKIRGLNEEEETKELEFQKILNKKIKRNSNENNR